MMLCAMFGWNWPSGSGEEDFKYFQYNFTISLLFPLGKGRGPSFEQTSFPSTQGCFVPSLVEIGPVVLDKKSKIGKVYRQTDGWTDDEQQAIRKAHLSFQLRWAKNHLNKNSIHINIQSCVSIESSINKSSTLAFHALTLPINGKNIKDDYFF